MGRRLVCVLFSFVLGSHLDMRSICAVVLYIVQLKDTMQNTSLSRHSTIHGSLHRRRQHQPPRSGPSLILEWAPGPWPPGSEFVLSVPKVEGNSLKMRETHFEKMDFCSVHFSFGKEAHSFRKTHALNDINFLSIHWVSQMFS